MVEFPYTVIIFINLLHFIQVQWNFLWRTLVYNERISWPQMSFYYANFYISRMINTLLSTQCAKDCGPFKHTCMHTCICMSLYTPALAGIHVSQSILNKPKVFFQFFLNSMCEESSQPTKHANKIIIPIFLTIKATILETHGNRI